MRPAPTRTPVAISNADDTPRQAVATFYRFVASGRFTGAAGLWSDSMRERYPPAQYIDGRFARTTRIDLNNLTLTRVDEAAGTARVGVDLTEFLEDGSVRRFVGAWDVVRTSAGWRLDNPYF